MKTNKFWVIIFASICGCLGLYFWCFNGELSLNSQDWAAFSTYFNGIIMPILTIINIFVFIKLTIAIDNKQTERHTKEINFQQKQILTNMRQNEIDFLVSILNEVGMQQDVAKQMIHCSKCQFTLITLMKSKQLLFPMIDNKPVYKAMLELDKNLKDLGAFYKRTLGLMCSDPGSILTNHGYSPEDNNTHIDLLRNVTNNKHIVIEGLSNFNIEQLTI